MKFLFVGSSAAHGGAEVHFVALARALRGEGHEVAAMVDPDSFIATELASSGVALYPRGFRNAIDPKALSMLVKAIRASGPDVLVSNFGKDYWAVTLAGWLFNVRVTLFRHRVKAMDRASRSWLPKLCDGYFADSDFARRLYQRQGVAEHRIQVLNNPVDLQRFRFDPEARRDIRQAHGIAPDAVVVGFCGRLVRSKGIHVLREAVDAAMAREPRLHCLWVGEGADAADLRAAIASGGYAPRHHFAGEVVDASAYYSAFSLLAAPSIVAGTSGRACIEAQACGVPVIGSDLGGIPETLWAGRSGVLVAAADVAAWTRAILLLCDDQRRAVMASNARPFVSHRFSKPIIARQLVGFLRGFER